MADEQQMIDYIVLSIKTAEANIEQLAGETGKRQEKTMGMRDDSGREMLKVQLTCEPRQFAKKEITGIWAPIFKKLV